jgi:hypothetical protein
MEIDPNKGRYIFFIYKKMENPTAIVPNLVTFPDYKHPTYELI